VTKESTAALNAKRWRQPKAGPDEIYVSPSLFDDR
jgi:hypothetical protein